MISVCRLASPRLHKLGVIKLTSCLQQLIRIAFIPRSGLLKKKYTVRLRTAMKISLKLLYFILIKGRGCELIRSISLGTPSLKQTG